MSVPPQLYDLSKDIGETDNLAAQHPAVVERLTKRAADLRRDTDIPPPLTP